MRSLYHGVAWVIVNNKVKNGNAGRWLDMYPTKREAIAYLDGFAERIGENEWKSEKFESLSIKKQC